MSGVASRVREGGAGGGRTGGRTPGVAAQAAAPSKAPAPLEPAKRYIPDATVEETATRTRVAAETRSVARRARFRCFLADRFRFRQGQPPPAFITPGKTGFSFLPSFLLRVHIYLCVRSRTILVYREEMKRGRGEKRW